MLDKKMDSYLVAVGIQSSKSWVIRAEDKLKTKSHSKTTAFVLSEDWVKLN